MTKTISGKERLCKTYNFILDTKYTDKSLFGGQCRGGIFQKKKCDPKLTIPLQIKGQKKKGATSLCLQGQSVRGERKKTM